MRVVKAINEWVGRVCAFLIVPLIGMILLEVALRFFFNLPTSWVHESSGYLLAAYSVLAGGYALLHRAHVNVDILFTRFSPRKQSVISLFTWVLFFYYFAIIIWRTGEASLFSIQIWEHSPSTWGPLFWPVRLLIPIGSILILLQGIVQFLEDLIFAVQGRKLT
jgi:TRAP-type mannitol/chloroaromatic compound transport system permease small subunit